MREHHVLNLGAGVQSTTLYLFCTPGFGLPYALPAGNIPMLDYAIFADTGEEPAAVYEHLRWLQSLGGPPISTGQRFASIPAYTRGPDDSREGRLRRQCTKEYKIDVIDRAIRREVLGMKARQRVPSDVRVINYYGISADEAGRAERLKRNPALQKLWLERRFPLIDMGWTRTHCETWLAEHVPHSVPRSACVFCPYHSDREWALVKSNREDWLRAVEVDRALRTPGVVANRNVDKPLYLHRSCQPLELVELKPAQVPTLPLFSAECLGACGL